MQGLLNIRDMSVTSAAFQQEIFALQAPSAAGLAVPAAHAVRALELTHWVSVQIAGTRARACTRRRRLWRCRRPRSPSPRHTACAAMAKKLRFRGGILTRTTARAAAASVARVEWARSCASEKDWEWYMKPRLCREAAARGHLEVLKCLRAEGCPWDELACAEAAGGGHLEVLKWLRAEGCPWDEWACAKASQSGHLEVLKWLLAEGCPWNRHASKGAAENGLLEVVKVMQAEGCYYAKRCLEDWPDESDE